MQTVWIVAPYYGYGYEGLGEPLAAFPDKTDAIRWGQNHFKTKAKGWKVLPVKYIAQPKRQVKLVECA